MTERFVLLVDGFALAVILDVQLHFALNIEF